MPTASSLAPMRRSSSASCVKANDAGSVWTRRRSSRIRGSSVSTLDSLRNLDVDILGRGLGRPSVVLHREYDDVGPLLVVGMRNGYAGGCRAITEIPEVFRQETACRRLRGARIEEDGPTG